MEPSVIECEIKARAIIFKIGVEDCINEIASGSISPTEAIRVVLDKTSEYRPMFANRTVNYVDMARKASELIGNDVHDLFDVDNPFYNTISKWHCMGWFCAAQAALDVQPGSLAGVKPQWMVDYKF